MLKQTVQFVDFDDVNKTKNLYFNLTRAEVIENIELRSEFEEVQEMIGGATRDLEIHEVKLILNLVKKLMKLSYGIQKQTAEGDLKFTKKDEIWDDFVETAYYDAFLLGLFEEPKKAVEFLVGIWPRELREGIDTDQLKLPGMPVKLDGQPLQVAPDSPEAQGASAWTEYTQEALLAMSKQQFDEIAGTDPTKMPQELLQIAFRRRATGN